MGKYNATNKNILDRMLSFKNFKALMSSFVSVCFHLL